MRSNVSCKFNCGSSSGSFFGVGIWTGSVVGFTVAYMRLRWMETHIDEHMFCRGNLIKRGKGIKPSAKVFDIRELKKEPEDEE